MSYLHSRNVSIYSVGDSKPTYSAEQSWHIVIVILQGLAKKTLWTWQQSEYSWLQWAEGYPIFLKLEICQQDIHGMTIKPHINYKN